MTDFESFLLSIYLAPIIAIGVCACVFLARGNDGGLFSTPSLKFQCFIPVLNWLGAALAVAEVFYPSSCANLPERKRGDSIDKVLSDAAKEMTEGFLEVSEEKFNKFLEEAVAKRRSLSDEDRFNEDAAGVKFMADMYLKEWFGERCPIYAEECESCKRYKLLDDLLENPFSKIVSSDEGVRVKAEEENSLP